LQEDTYSGDVNDPLSLNLYTYCHNEPLMYTDPTGHYYQKQYVANQGLVDVWINEEGLIGTVNNAKHLAEVKVQEAKEVLSGAVSYTVENVVKPAVNYVGGVIVSGAKDLVVDPVIDLTSATSAMAEYYRLLPKGSPSGIRTALKQGEDTIENKIEEHLVTDKVAYYSGRVTGDKVSTVIGLAGMVQGVTNIIAGGTAMLGGAVTVETIVGPIVLEPAGAIAVTAGAIETAYGGDVAWNSYRNGSINYSKLQNAISARNTSKGVYNTKPSGEIGGSPEGKRATNKANADPEFKRGIQRENESADILADAGYKIEQQPVTAGPKNPDFRIEGKIFDNYAPTTRSPRGVRDGIAAKVEKGQADRIVLNMSDTNVQRFALRQELANKPISGLKEIIMIDKLGNIIHFYP
jgi:hypothetical protein